MSIKDWPGGIISKEQVVPSGPYLNSTASGIWTMDQAASYTKQGIWPTAGNVEPDVASNFSTYLYEGNSGTLSVNNGIDFAGDGGLLWIKNRGGAYNHLLIDTVSGGTKYLNSNATTLQQTFSSGEEFTFSSTGFSSTAADFKWNNSGNDYTSWSFKKQAKFFDIVTYTGTASVQNISHNLGSVPGMIIVKRLDSSSFNWQIYHRNSNATPEDYRLEFTTGAAQLNTGVWGSTAPTDTHFTVGANGDSNGSGAPLVAYLFAHETGADSMIRCGSYTNSSSGIEVNLGFEPQWLLVKKSSATGNWAIVDKMRGWRDTGAAGDNAEQLRPNLSNTENAEYHPTITPTGFKTYGEGGGGGSSVGTFVYVAVRAPMMIAPTVGTEVFNMDGFVGRTSGSWFRTGTGSSTTFPADFALRARPNHADEKNALTRILGDKMLRTDSSGSVTTSGNAQWDWMDGYADAVNNTTHFSWMWKSAKSFFSVATYTGDGTSSNSVRTAAIPHNLGVQPEMVWVKRRDTTSEWVVAHKDYGAGYLNLSNSLATFPVGGINFDDAFTATNFKINGWQQEANFNVSGSAYIAYLFSSLAGVSKVGSYTGNGGSQTIDCGFSSGARFILIKRADSTGDWWVLDTERGIAAGNDQLITLNDTTAQTAVDVIDPNNSGFTVDTTNADFNASGGNYIFYAIA